MLQRLIDARVTIDTHLADNLHAVLADATQLDHVLVNLAVNARDAMPRGGTLTMVTANVELDEAYARVHQGARPGSYVLVSVTDTGVGMSRDVEARIFEPYFTTKEQGRGTGLGLAAVYGIVKQLDGYIEVESEPDKGTTFRLYLPRTEQPARMPAAPVAPVGTPVGRETILVVEDEAGVRRFIISTLHRFGYRVIEAEHAEAAIATLETLTLPIDLLLTDVILPGMSGRELAARVLRERPELRVLYMSGYTGRYLTTNDALEPGVELIEKPFTAHALLTRTRQLLGRPVS